MKKFFIITISFLTITLVLSGCGNNKVNDTDIDDERQMNNSVEGFNGEINSSWAEVEDEYNALEIEAKREVDEMDDITKNDIKELTDTIRTKYEVVKNGINENNKEDAKELYKASIKLQEIAKKDGTRVNHEITTLAENGEALIKHYYGEADRNYSDVLDEFKDVLDNIKDYTDEKWNEFLDLIK